LETTTISHIVLLPASILDEEESFFQGFSKPLLKYYLGIFYALSKFPHDLMELYLDRNNFVISKIGGSSLDIHLIREDLLDSEYVDFDRKFNVVWSTEATFNSAVTACSKFEIEPIHITTKERTNIQTIQDLDETRVTELLLKLANQVAIKSTDCEFSNFVKSLLNTRTILREDIKFPFEPLNHYCVEPSLMVLSSYGYYIEKMEITKPSGDTHQHVNAIINVCDEIDRIRSSINIPKIAKKSDAIIYCPSIYTYLYKSEDAIWKNLYRHLNKNQRNFLKKSLIRNKGYGNTSLDVNKSSTILEDIKILEPLLMMRQEELRIFTISIGIAATNMFAPALRLPNSVMLHHDILKDLASLITSRNPKNLTKLNAKLISYNKNLKKDIGEELLATCFNNRKSLLIVCDIPMEWLSIDSVPLMFTHEISRICSTPGNLTLQLLLSGQRMLINSSAFLKVMILRSFTADDPIRNHLTMAIEVFQKNNCYQNIEIQILDIETEAQLIEELDNFDGAILIFDCHGSHGGEKENAWLHIGKEQVNVWQLSGRCRIPPIIILSACSTHAIDGSHASVANGLLRCGCVSVIGTYAPIKADHSAVFVSRLIYRIAKFIPIITKDSPISWREIVTGFLRMSYVTDVLMGFNERLNLLSKDQLIDIGIKMNYSINSGSHQWHYEMLDLLSEATGKNIEDIKKYLNNEFQFVESMLYSQLGRPENILIYTN
jgi:hypothetical protein